MLQITIPEKELWDEKEEKFIYIKKTTLSLEHSLLSISKWESKWNKSFLSSKDKTIEETLDYIKCMTLNQNIPDVIYICLTEENFKEIQEYVNAPMTATTFSNLNGAPNREKITSELIYFWMINFNIPFECQKWHLNRLLTLIKVCDIKNRKPEKMTKSQILQRNAELNAARRKQLNSKG